MNISDLLLIGDIKTELIILALVGIILIIMIIVLTLIKKAKEK